jgi:hypothetical protein
MTTVYLLQSYHKSSGEIEVLGVYSKVQLALDKLYDWVKDINIKEYYHFAKSQGCSRDDPECYKLFSSERKNKFDAVIEIYILANEGDDAAREHLLDYSDWLTFDWDSHNEYYLGKYEVDKGWS